jgi:hypothetical protein
MTCIDQDVGFQTEELGSAGKSSGRQDCDTAGSSQSEEVVESRDLLEAAR